MRETQSVSDTDSPFDEVGVSLLVLGDDQIAFPSTFLTAERAAFSRPAEQVQSLPVKTGRARLLGAIVE